MKTLQDFENLMPDLKNLWVCNESTQFTDEAWVKLSHMRFPGFAQGNCSSASGEVYQYLTERCGWSPEKDIHLVTIHFESGRKHQALLVDNEQFGWFVVDFTYNQFTGATKGIPTVFTGRRSITEWASSVEYLTAANESKTRYSLDKIKRVTSEGVRIYCGSTENGSL